MNLSVCHCILVLLLVIYLNSEQSYLFLKCACAFILLIEFVLKIFFKVHLHHYLLYNSSSEAVHHMKEKQWKTRLNICDIKGITWQRLGGSWKKEKSKSNGVAAEFAKKWKCLGVLSVLDSVTWSGTAAVPKRKNSPRRAASLVTSWHKGHQDIIKTSTRPKSSSWSSKNPWK